MKFFNILIVLFFVFSVTACKTNQYSTKKNNYIKQSKILPPIVVPPGVNAPNQKPYYPIPTNSVSVAAATKHKPSLKPPSLQE